MFATIFWAVLLGLVTCREVDKIPMWTDLGLGRLTDWEDLDFKLAFLMDTYDVVSLEKCLFRGSNDQNTVSVSAAQHCDGIAVCENLVCKLLSLTMAGGGVPEPDVEDAPAEAGVEHQDPLLLELHPPQLLPVHARVRL